MSSHPASGRACHILLTLGASALVLLAASVAAAEGPPGALFVPKQLGPRAIKVEGQLAPASVWVYTPDGALVRSKEGAGVFAPGQPIELPAGEYLVEIGRTRSRYNLHRYRVEAGKTTLVRVGWIAVVTWPATEQPTQGCSPWSAELRAAVRVDDAEHTVSTNADVTPAAPLGMLQLHEGRYRVYFHGLPVDVEVTADRVVWIATGVAGPVGTPGARLAAAKGEGSGIPAVGLCADGAIHVPAGSWWLSQTIRMEEYPFERQQWSPLEVTPLDAARTRELPAERGRGATLTGAAAQPGPVQPEEARALTAYADGEIQSSTQGRFKNSPIKGLFLDPNAAP